MAKTQDNTTAEDKVELDVMPGADPISEEEAKPFEVDMNFETPEEEDEEEAQEEADENVEVEEEPLEEPEEDEEEEVVEAADAEAEDSGEEELLAEDEGDTQQPEGTDEAGLAQKEPMIPKSRFDEVLAKQKALQKKLDDALAPQVEDVKEAPEFDFDTKEIEYQTLVMEGESEKATQLRKEIREAEKQQMMFEVQAKMGQTVSQNQEMVDLQTKATQLESMYPELNQANPEFNQDKTNEVLELRDAYMTQGYMGADALDKAVKLLMGTPATQAQKADPVQEKIVEKKKIANTTKKVQASEKQPPAMKGKNKVEKKVDINKMSVDEFSALPDETLRRMRGDFG
tara:strand:+ start:2005 stop:3033 length:1029 start_codon:yes stop_codon:yes gene_type:complete